MPIYSGKDLGGKIDVRELEMVDGVTKNIWVPELAFLYKRTHFNVQMIPGFAHCNRKIMDCFNQNYSSNPQERGLGCPLCKAIDVFWDKWRAAKDKDEKKKIKETIGKLVSEYFYMNVIDIDDEDLRFFAARFTGAKMHEIKTTESTLEAKSFSLSDRIFLYKYVEKPRKEYSLNDTKNSITDKLTAEYNKLKSRAYDDGGPIDLDAAYLSYAVKDIDKYLEMLNSEESSKSSSSKSSETKTTIVEEESLGLDDLDGLDGKKETKTTEKKSNDIDASDLDLDSIQLDDLEPAKEMIVVTTEDFMKNYKDTKYRCDLYDKMFKRKMITEIIDGTPRAKLMLEYFKANKTFQYTKE